MTKAENKYRLGIDQIQKFLPHRAPFLLVDRVLEILPTGEISDMSPATKVGTKVEHFVLDGAKPVRQLTVGKSGKGSTDRAIRFVDLADRSHSRRRF